MRVCAYGAERSIHAQRARLRLPVKRFQLAKNFCHIRQQVDDERDLTPDQRMAALRDMLEMAANAQSDRVIAGFEVMVREHYEP